MAEHTHGCLQCRPEMVPDFDRDDARFHHHEKCGRLTHVTLDGVVQLLTNGTFEGSEGWVLFVGVTSEDAHMCTLHPNDLCVEPRFGRVEVVHECPAVAAAFLRRVDPDVAAIKLLVDDAKPAKGDWTWVGEQGPELIRPGDAS